ncbi:MAG: hypothetical protein KF795_15330 [Labilithrix sp.]|nr:hypothetical protein [Labilithrix sp.]
MTNKTPSAVVFTLVLAASTAGCFAVFGLDGYGPPAPVEDAGVTDVADVVVPVEATVDAGPPPPKLVFVTADRFTAYLGGLADVDARCQVLAERAGFSGRTFKAWLSDDTASPSTRFADFVANAGPQLVLADETVVATSYAELADSGPRVPIRMTERGVEVPIDGPAAGPGCPSGAVVWSNTNPNGGAVDQQSCSGWTSNSQGLGRVGVLAGSDRGGWTAACAVPCASEAHLYCFEQ